MPAQVSFSGSEPKNIRLGPFTKGMFRDVSPLEIPNGGVYTAKNFIVGVRGLKRRPALRKLGDGRVLRPPLLGLGQYWRENGDPDSFCYDSKFVYSVAPDAYTPRCETFASGVIDGTSGGYTIFHEAIADWSSGDVSAGDIIYPGSNVAADADGSYLIESVDGSQLTLASPLGATYNDSNFIVRLAHRHVPGYIPDFAIRGNAAIFADGEHVLKKLYSPSGTPVLTTFDDSNTFIADTVTYQGSRVFVGRIQDGATDYRGHTRWSRVLDNTDFTDYLGAKMYADLFEDAGRVLRVEPLGKLLVAYLEEGVYIGRPTNFGDPLPYAFDPIPTGGIGLVGPRAVFPHTDGHFFIGQDNIYFLSANISLKPIGSPVVSATIQHADYLWQSYVALDVPNERLVFGFGNDTGGTTMETVWSFCYKTGAWSYDETECTMLATMGLTAAVTYDTLASVAEDDSIDAGLSIFGTYADISGTDYGNRLWYGISGSLHYLSDETAQDFATDSIECEIETKDYDHGLGDIRKTWTRLSVKIDRELDDDLEFTVTGSTDQGYSWESLGTLTIEAGYDEAFINFLITGSTVRYRLRSSSNVTCYVILDMITRVKPRGIEAYQGTTD